jgi:cobalt/nickel transport system permease protein
MPMLLAVHIGNEVLTGRWELGGFGVAAILVVVSAWRLHEDEIPRISLLAAAFFVASSMHIPVPPASAHLLLNGLVGVVLGWRAPLAILVGLVLQAVLLGHGGYLALGVNCCVVSIPALVAWAVFRGLNRLPGLYHPTVRAVLVGGAFALWFVCVVLWLAPALYGHGWSEHTLDEEIRQVVDVLINPWTVLLAVTGGGLAALVERHLENAPEFPLGLLVGVVSVLLTLALDTGVLIAGSADVSEFAIFFFVMLHLPIAVIEGVIVGFTVGFLAKVKPELLGLKGTRACATS